MNRTFPLAVGTALTALLGLGLATAQTRDARPQLAEDVFKNVPVLRGMPVDEFMDTMGMFASALGMNCTDCHTLDTNDGWENFAKETPLKQTARRMILMVNSLNSTSFGGQRKVTCFTCHRGVQRPKVVPSLAIQYGAPLEDPNEVELPAQNIAGLPSANQIFDAYLAAIGGTQRVTGLTSFAARGTYEGYDTEHVKVTVEIYAKAPDQRAMVVHAPFGDKVSTYDGRAAWMASADRPIPLMPLTGGNLQGARVDAVIAFPAQIRQAFAPWRVGLTSIDDRDVYVLQGTPQGQIPVNLYFDQESRLLVRMVRWTDTAVGRIPTQVDYMDYRETSGIKLPFRWTTTWTNGQYTIVLNEVQPNISIEAARFGRPAPAPQPKL